MALGMYDQDVVHPLNDEMVGPYAAGSTAVAPV